MGSGNKGWGVSGRAHDHGRQPGGNLLDDTVGIAAVRRISSTERFRPMPARDRRASTIDLTADLSVLSPQRAREFLATALEANAKTGVIRRSNVPWIIVRPEATVNIQRQH